MRGGGDAYVGLLSLWGFTFPFHTKLKNQQAGNDPRLSVVPDPHLLGCSERVLQEVGFSGPVSSADPAPHLPAREYGVWVVGSLGSTGSCDVIVPYHG